MKKTLLAIAVLGAFVGAAQAQSSVTLSGSVDLGVRYSNDVWAMTNGGSSRTNFTLSGTEDLGGGMRVFFLANHRFNLNNGTQRDANAFWRQGWVGLGGNFGDLRLGKILPPVQDFNGQFEPWGGGDTVGSTHTGGLFAGNSALGSRYNNSIYYRSPSLGGLVGHAMIAAADNNAEVGSTATLPPGGAERPMGFGAIYGAGPLRLAAAYDVNANDWTTYGLYGSFNAGFATFMAQFETGEYTNAGNDVSRWSIGATVPFGAALLKFGYTDWKDEDVSKFGIGLDYMMSKRTTLYTNIGDLSGNGKAGTPVGTLNNNARKTQFDLGIVHRF
ncbi:MAG TPA: porin [Acidiferrobacterales bacterium]|nr:porin [Acidiferrobacterales bacterium]